MKCILDFCLKFCNKEMNCDEWPKAISGFLLPAIGTTYLVSMDSGYFKKQIILHIKDFIFSLKIIIHFNCDLNYFIIFNNLYWNYLLDLF